MDSDFFLVIRIQSIMKGKIAFFFSTPARMFLGKINPDTFHIFRITDVLSPDE